MNAIRIAMWSGPRNISTAMMRAFENRADTVVSDEPFYAAYLAATKLNHPMRDEILAAQPQDWQAVVAAITGPVPRGRPIWYQKHMTHHMLPAFGRSWIDAVTNAFLIRTPEAVLASYIEKRAEVTLEDIGFPQQVELFERVADRIGKAPPVIEAGEVLRDPRNTPDAALRPVFHPVRRPHAGLAGGTTGKRRRLGAQLVWTRSSARPASARRAPSGRSTTCPTA